MFERISMVGLGYIGLPTAALFAAHGTEVIGVDVSQHVVDTINAGNIHIVEPELVGIVHKAVADNMLRATLEPEPAEAFIVAVPPPFKNEYQPDLGYIQSASNMIASVLKKGKDAIMNVLSARPLRAMSDVKVACLGLAFIPDIDDLRESPALQITRGTQM